MGYTQGGGLTPEQMQQLGMQNPNSQMIADFLSGGGNTGVQMSDADKKQALFQALLMAGAQTMAGPRMNTGQAIGNLIGQTGQGYAEAQNQYQKTIMDYLKQKQAQDLQESTIGLNKAKTIEAEAKAKNYGQVKPMTAYEQAKEGRTAEKQKQTDLAEQNVAIYNDPSQFAGMVPEDVKTAQESVKAAAQSQDSSVWNRAYTANKAKEPPKSANIELIRGALKQQLGGTEPTDLQIADEMQRRGIEKGVTVAVSGAEARGRAYADNRIVDVFDAGTGHVIKVRGKVANDNPDRYLDKTDPEVKSYANITKNMDSISAFDKGATNALNLATSVAKDYSAGQFPGVNKVSQLFSYHAGDEKIKGLKNSLTTAATEYMKVVNAGTNLTAAELSVMGQQRAKEIIEASDNLPSLINSINIMKKEMTIAGNRNKQQRQEIANRNGWKVPDVGIAPTPSYPDQPQGAAPSQGAMAPMTATNPKTGQKIQSTDGGKTWQ